MNLQPVDLNQVRRVLIIKMSALGDIVHALPVSAALKQTYPHLELSWAVEEMFAPLVAYNPYLHKVFKLPKMSGRRLRSGKAWRECVKKLNGIRQENFEVTLDLQGLTKSATVAAWSGAKVRLGYHWLRELAPLMEAPVPQQPGSVHIVDQYLDVARFLGAEPRRVQFPLVVPDEDEQAVTQMLREGGIAEGAPFIAVNPASAQRIKMWGVEKYGGLLDAVSEELGLPAVLVTADAEVAAQVAANTRLPFLNLARRTSLIQLVGVLQRCSAHVCGDTGSGHIAAALERPVVSIMGPTNPERLSPYGQQACVIRRAEQCGAGCDAHHCEFATPRCLQAVQVEDVIDKLRQCAAPFLEPSEKRPLEPCSQVQVGSEPQEVEART